MSGQQPIIGRQQRQAQSALLGRIISKVWNGIKVAGNWAMNHKKQVGYGLGALASAGVLYLGYRKFSDSDVIFNGEINGNYVRYEEDRGLLFEENVMTLRKNGQTYVFVDSSGEHNLYWEENTPRFGDDKLERIEMRDGVGRLSVIESDDINKDNIKGERAERAFEVSNNAYNTTRGKIREKLRKRFVEDCERLERDLESLTE